MQFKVVQSEKERSSCCAVISAGDQISRVIDCSCSSKVDRVESNLRSRTVEGSLYLLDSSGNEVIYSVHRLEAQLRRRCAAH